MPTSPDRILELYNERRRLAGPTIEALREVRDVYNGDILIPLPEMDQSEKPAVANLIAEGIDQVGMRVASTMPHVMAPALNPRIEQGRRSVEWGDIRRRTMLSWWEQNRIRRIRRRQARFVVAYGSAPTMLAPDFEREIPQWHVRHPLHTYPNPSEDWDDDNPLDCIFAFRKSLAWLRANYPEQATRIYKGEDPQGSKLFTLLEYIDAEERVLAVAGSEDYSYYHDPEAMVLDKVADLERIPNRAGVCTVVTPKRISLDRLCGQFNQIIGLYQGQAMLTALDLIATKKSVFPDLVMMGENGQAPQLLGDEWKDGSSGEINEMVNGKVESIQLQPGYKTGEAIDRLERGMRQHGISPQFGGETGPNIRSGRQHEVLMSAQIDFRIMEYQETLADADVQAFKKAIAIARGYFGDKPKSFNVNWRHAEGPVDYVPNKHFETDMVQVVYPMAGADVNGIVMGVGQRMGMGTMSRETGRQLDPLIEHPELEGDKVTAQRLEDALLEGLQVMASQGQIPPSDVASIQHKVFRDGKTLADAVEEVQQEAQERQAEEHAEGDPALQPGIAEPGAGAEGTPAIPDAEPSMSNMARLLYNTRQPQSRAGGQAPAQAGGPRA